MNATDSLFSLAVPLGRFLGTRLRLSVLMLIAVLAVVWRVQTFTTSVLFAAVLFLSVCLHEITHLWFTHRLNLRCPERILWPFGGLFGEAPRRTNPLVSLAGAGMNLVLAVAAACQLSSRSEILTLLNPATTWQGLASDSMLLLLMRIIFVVNTMMALANLIPVRPLAAGYVLQNFLSRRFSEIESHDILLRSGLVLSIFGLLAGFVFDLSGLAALSAFLLLLHVQEAVHWFQPTTTERSFSGYDYSDNYAVQRHDDLDQDDSDDDIPGSVVDRWKSRRESEREVRERELEQREHDELDRVLEKLHTMGRDALSIAELHLLNRVSARLRQKNH
jgi:Zn-dependent protease